MKTIGGVRVSDVDGVRVLHADAPGPLRAVLMFRVGQADETLPIRGTTHLVEHLALSVTGKGPHAFNGATGSTLTTFVVVGDPDDVAEHLRRVCASLRALPAERFDHEREVLRAEAAASSKGATAALLAWRHGPQGYGLPGFDEVGLRGLNIDAAQAWADRWFTRQNAVAWISGPLPPGFSLDLKDGASAPPPPTPDAVVPIPSCFTLGPGGMGLHLLARRGMTLPAVQHVLTRRLQRRLRDELAISYGVQSAADRFSAGTASIVTIADCVPDRSSDLQEAALEVLERLKSDAVTDDEVREIGDLARLGRTDDAARTLAHADFLARELLLGGEVTTIEQIDAEVDGLTAADVQTAVEEALATLVAGVPDATKVDEQVLARAPIWSEKSVPGLPVPPTQPHQNKAQLIIGDDGVSLWRAGNAVTVRFDECAGMLRFDDGARTLIGRDGFAITYRPEEWKDPEWVVPRLDEGVRPDLWIPAGPRERPATAPTPPPAPKPLSRRARRWLSNRFLVVLAVIVAINLVRLASQSTGGSTGSTDPLPPGAGGVTTISDLSPGDCIQLSIGGAFHAYVRTSCHEPHESEVIAVVNATSESAGIQRCQKAALQRIATPTDDYVVTTDRDQGSSLTACLARGPGEERTAPLRRR